MSNQAKRQAPVVLKIGGNFFNILKSSANADNALLTTIQSLQEKHRDVVIVHGGGEQVLARLNDLGIKSVRKDGLRITPDAHMPIVSGVLAGELNKLLVAQCAIYNINAVGISLADGNMAVCHEHPANIGAVGVPTAKSADLLKALLQANMVPVVASIGRDDSGRLYNVNADHGAICIAKLLNTKLYFFADVIGVLDENKHLIPQLDKQQSTDLISRGVITDGMAVKVVAAQFAANQIQQPVTIGSWNDAAKILISKEICGTEIMPSINI